MADAEGDRPLVQLDVEAGIGIITIDNPPVNALVPDVATVSSMRWRGAKQTRDGSGLSPTVTRTFIGCGSFVVRAIWDFPSTRCELLRLWSDQKRSHAHVRSLALEDIRGLECRATQLRSMISTLKQVVAACEHAHRPECPIIRELESDSTVQGR